MSDILIYFPEGYQIHVLVTYRFVICIYDLTYTICTKSPTDHSGEVNWNHGHAWTLREPCVVPISQT